MNRRSVALVGRTNSTRRARSPVGRVAARNGRSAASLEGPACSAASPSFVLPPSVSPSPLHRLLEAQTADGHAALGAGHERLAPGRRDHFGPHRLQPQRRRPLDQERHREGHARPQVRRRRLHRRQARRPARPEEDDRHGPDQGAVGRRDGPRRPRELEPRRRLPHRRERPDRRRRPHREACPSTITGTVTHAELMRRPRARRCRRASSSRFELRIQLISRIASVERYAGQAPSFWFA